MPTAPFVAALAASEPTPPISSSDVSSLSDECTESEDVDLGDVTREMTPRIKEMNQVLDKLAEVAIDSDKRCCSPSSIYNTGNL
jgi:hypothetical protein